MLRVQEGSLKMHTVISASCRSDGNRTPCLLVYMLKNLAQ
jgi:hypothetical protein